MKHGWPLLLVLLVLAPAAPGAETIRDEAANFENSPPPDAADDWDSVAIPGDRKDIKAHYKTSFADSDPPAVGEVQLIVHPLSSDYAAKSLEHIAAQWADAMEGSIQNPRDLKQGKTTLGGEEAYFRDVQGDYGSGVAHITWYVTRMGKAIYVLHMIRTYRAVGNRELEAEVHVVRLVSLDAIVANVPPDAVEHRLIRRGHRIVAHRLQRVALRDRGHEAPILNRVDAGRIKHAVHNPPDEGPAGDRIGRREGHHGADRIGPLEVGKAATDQLVIQRARVNPHAWPR